VYWGKVGETPGWSEHHKDPEWSRAHGGGSPRFSGGGEYAGVLVVVVAIWAVAQSFRRTNSVFSPIQRKFIWFWAAAAFISLLLAFGRYAPFYQFFYMLPYFSTIRNPAKFTHPFNWSLVILFAYGIHGLSRRYLGTRESNTQSKPAGLLKHLSSWWAKADSFEKKWTKGSAAAIAVSLLGLVLYASSKTRLEQHLMEVGFPEASTAAQIAGFSILEVVYFIFFLLVTLGLLIVILSGRFGGTRARVGATLLCALLLVDLGRANLPWILYWDYKEKYATNPVVEALRSKPYEHRVAIFPLERFNLPPNARELYQVHTILHGVYSIEWAQHLFQYYDIQSLDVIQMPRQSVEYVAFETEFARNPIRRWELTNTKYLLAPADLLAAFSPQLPWNILMRFDIVPKPGQTELRTYDQFMALANTNGRYAVFSVNSALPRAKLYTNWQVSKDDQATLALLAKPEFDPAKTVLVTDPIPSSSTNSLSEAQNGQVDFVSYAPKRIVLQAKASAPSVLLLNDKHDPNWKVTVDGKAAALLRCNYLMRGVQVPAGDHRIEFRFQPPITGLYISLAAIGLGFVLIGFLAVSKPPEPIAPAPDSPEPPPKREAKPAARSTKSAQTASASRSGAGLV